MDVGGGQHGAGVPPVGAQAVAPAAVAAADSLPAVRAGQRSVADPASLGAGRAGIVSTPSAFQAWAPPLAAAGDMATQLQGQGRVQGNQQAAAASAEQEGRRPAPVASGENRTALDGRLAQLPLDVRMAFEAGVQAGLREEVVAAALARYLDIVGAPETASAL